MDIAFHTQQKSGEVVKLIDEGAENLAELQRSVVIEILPSALSAVVFLFIGFHINQTLTLMLIGAIVCYVLIVVIGTTRTMKLQMQANRAWVERIGRAYDAVTNIFSVKSGAQERWEVQKLEISNARVFDRQMRVNRRWAAVEAINIFMMTRILLTSIGVYLYVKNQLSLGGLYFFQSSFYRVLTPLEMLSGILPFWNKKMGKVRLSQELFQTPVSVKNAPSARIPDGLKGRIQFEQVCFSYGIKAPVIDLDALNDAADEQSLQNIREREHQADDENPHPPAHEHPRRLPDCEECTNIPVPTHAGEVLHNITLDVTAGERVAFVGHSGAGKTTLAALVNRFYDVTEGSIMVDGTDLRLLDLQWWRAQIGLVLQDNIMFNDSILENIRYARPDATDEEVKQAARRAAAAEFIEPLPQGYHTLIGDRGIRLSGGQRQRVAIARAILKNPKIVVLDEATSALDSVTEKRVQDGIKELIKDRTSFIIAHRLSTVRSVDRIAVFHKGLLIDVAPHETLMKRCDIYREMVELQSQGMLAE